MIALDLFAGHGWGVACRRLGIEEYGVEIMPEARAIRTANGMQTWLEDVWDVLANADPDSPAYKAELEIASPPCQKFSMAGKGTGRSATAEVLRLIDEHAYLRPDDLRAFAAEHEDDGIALVLAPLASAAMHTPTYVVWEQVPPVLPVWERAAAEMEGWGYSVWTGILNAEQYGVPQTRRRAVLIARADGKEAAPPTPTHSRYYSRDPKRLDSGVLPWVSMAEALGWGMTERPMVTAGNAVGRAEGGGGSGAKAAIVREKERGAWVDINGDETEWPGRRPSTTVVGSFRPDLQAGPGYRKAGDGPRQKSPGTMRVTVAEAAALQSYPTDFVWDVIVDTPRGPKPITKTKQFLTIGNAVPPLMAEAIIRAAIS